MQFYALFGERYTVFGELLKLKRYAWFVFEPMNPVHSLILKRRLRNSPFSLKQITVDRHVLISYNIN